MAKKLLEKTVEKAGLMIEKHLLAKRIFFIAMAINLAISFYITYTLAAAGGFPLVYVTVIAFFLWTLIFILVLFASWLIFYLILDLRIYKRRVSIEEVLPDFLQLTAANIRAGMTPDKALWYAVRPRFGVLANEIETVAKETMSGESLATSLYRFADKYDSQLLKRSVNLLVEGMEAGGELGEVLNKVANNIQETRILQKEMSANVTTYVIFITVAVVVGAPILLALSHELLVILGTITSSIDIPASVSSAGIFSLSNVAINPSDFKTFAIIMLTITSFFSALMIAIIKKGTAKDGIKYIPTFIISSLAIYLLSLGFIRNALGSVLG